MQSNKWGPDAWSFFHTVSFNYPLDPKQCDKDAYKVFFESLKLMLPCSICRKSYNFFYDNFPIDNYLEDRNGVVYWLFILHNIVNMKLDKPTAKFRDVVLKYENNRAKCGNIDTSDTEKIKECQKPVKWNVGMESFVEDTFNKYNTVTIKNIAKMIKKNQDRDEIQHIIGNIEKLDE